MQLQAEILRIAMFRKCIYCDNKKGDTKFSFEHVIPQLLGGAQAPDRFKTYDVHSRCNSLLGRYVDASFGRSWFVLAWRHSAALASFNPDNPTALPLMCMGITTFNPPGMTPDQVCESWLGPLGEQVYWIRPKAEDFYWYSGGDPLVSSKAPSTAYFFFSERTLKAPALSWLSFRDAFKSRKNLKKIMCTHVNVDGGSVADIGFSEPNALDLERISFFKSIANVMDGEHHNKLSFNLKFDKRFLSKLALGISYCLFGDKVIETEYYRELRNGLWQKDDLSNGITEQDAFPKIMGTTPFGGNSDTVLNNLIGEEHAVTLFILPMQSGIALSLNLGKSMSWTVLCATYEKLNQDDIASIKDGLVIVLYEYLQKGVSLSLPDYLSYKLGNTNHPILTPLAKRIDRNKHYFANL